MRVNETGNYPKTILYTIFLTSPALFWDLACETGTQRSIFGVSHPLPIYAIFRQGFLPPPKMHCFRWFMAGGRLIKPASVSQVEGFSLPNLDGQYDNSCHNMQMS